jgi:hypothetical protein
MDSYIISTIKVRLLTYVNDLRMEKQREMLKSQMTASSRALFQCTAARSVKDWQDIPIFQCWAARRACVAH